MSVLREYPLNFLANLLGKNMATSGHEVSSLYSTDDDRVLVHARITFDADRSGAQHPDHEL